MLSHAKEEILHTPEYSSRIPSLERKKRALELLQSALKTNSIADFSEMKLSEGVSVCQ